MHSFFYRLYQLVNKNKISSIALALLFVLGCLFTISNIQFDEDITQMLPQKAMENETAKIWKNVRFQDKIAVIISKKGAATSDDLIATAQTFLDTLSIADAYIESVQGQTSDEVMQRSIEFVHQNLPLYLQESDYDSIAQRITPEAIQHQMQLNYETLISSSGSFFQEGIIKDPLNFTYLALPHLQNISVDEQFVFQDGYLFTKDYQRLVLFIQPKLAGSETKENQKFVALLERIQTNFNQKYTTSDLQYFGSSFIAVANAKQIQKDILTTISLSMTTLMVILMLYYRRIIIPILVFLPSLFGGLTALVVMYFITDRLSAISISISAILLGITIDYALHFLTHSKTINKPKTLFKEITRPLFMSSFTTAIAFLCLLFVDAKALNDLGWFAFIAVMASVFFTLVILPHIYKPKQSLPTANFIDKLAQYPFEKNRVLIAISFLLIIGSAFTYQKVTFDQDLSKINFFPEDQLQNQKYIEPENQETKSLYVVTYGNNLDNVLKQAQKVQNLALSDEKIIGVNSISSIVLDQKTQEERINRWNSFWKQHSLVSIEKEIVQNANALGFVDNTYADFAKQWSKSYTTIDLKTYQEVNENLINEFISENDGMFQQSTVVKIPTTYREVFLEKIESMQHTVVVDRQALNEELLGHLVTDFNDLVNISFIAVFLILWYFFRRLELVVLAAIPIALTGWITAGIMGAFHIPFNIFSSIVCTLIFGHGVDFTIFMTSALQKQYTYGKNEMPVYRTSIILAVLTTILAIGALIFAKHPALRSISSIALIGVCTAVLMTFVLYPLLFKFFIENRPRKGKSPVPLRIATESILFYTIFGLGGIVLSTFLRIFYWIAPLSKLKKRTIMATCMSKFMAFILSLKLGIKQKAIGNLADYKKEQSIVIANHSSFLDTLVIGKYNPKIIYLVNDWVINSPFFGRFAKVFGFFPVSQGVEFGVNHLQNRIGTDFTVVVFPEGTRSYTHEITRFKKGAFFLAESLQLPIQPIILHGGHEIIAKGDYMMFDGSMTHIVLPKIFQDSSIEVNSYSEKTKRVSKQFRKDFELWRKKLEDENYYKQKLFFNYLYKEHEIVSEVKTDFKKHKKAYLELNQILSSNESIVHITNDLGQTDFLLLKHGPSRKIQTIHKDRDRRQVCETSYLTKIRTLSYHDEFSEIQPTKHHILLVSHQATVDASILEPFNKVIFFLSKTTEIKNKKCTYSSECIEIYESE